MGSNCSNFGQCQKDKQELLYEINITKKNRKQQKWNINYVLTISSFKSFLQKWLGNKRDGQGTQIWPDGARYEGEWLNNKASGKGTFYHPEGDLYSGQWENDKAKGQGIQRLLVK